MRRLLLALGVLAFTAWAANIKLYLKDGSYHLVREYQVETDRVRFYSVERSEWEEMPLSLVDLDKTRTEEASPKPRLPSKPKRFPKRTRRNGRASRRSSAFRKTRASIGWMARKPRPSKTPKARCIPIRAARCSRTLPRCRWFPERPLSNWRARTR